AWLGGRVFYMRVSAPLTARSLASRSIAAYCHGLNGERAVTPRLHARDLAAVLAIVGLGLALRLHFFSGLGLGDDPLLRNDMAAPVRGTQLPGGPNGYRFAWWIPTAITARWWGLGEAGLITPIVVMDVLGMVLVALFAGQLWGGWSAVAAALMLAVFPLDVAW